mmetsp:Transcript_17600/g.16946  ORF Transcript_17600/g.16946 Transcript_17600/m.16946 type:complete len:94 (+) Transcript_17600:547-828(+)
MCLPSFTRLIELSINFFEWAIKPFAKDGFSLSFNTNREDKSATARSEEESGKSEEGVATDRWVMLPFANNSCGGRGGEVLDGKDVGSEKTEAG